MKCPRCKTVNRDEVKFCEECGTRFETECPTCKSIIPLGKNFCGECGHKLKKPVDPAKTIRSIESERKHVTILFSDLSGYTAITEKLDPEEVKGIMSQIFGKITDIIKNYDGYIERFIGDAVMAVFGVPKAHEDDPIRSIKAAMEIHATVENISPQFEKKIGRSLTMHTGINTGLVVTGEVDLEKGTHGLTGDAINLASRLEGIAKAGEIIVGPDTYNQALNYFEFKTLEPTKVKGKQKSINIYKVQSTKKEFFKTHRLQGLRATLTGRDKEMAILAEAAERIKQGQGSIIPICGDAGTGKSRLKKEFRETLNLEEIQWYEGHAYGYTRNTPYYPLINLLTHAFQIDEEDPPENIRRKIESTLSNLLGDGNKFAPYIGRLFSLTYREFEEVSPEYWKEKMQEAVQAILSALINRAPTIVCFEDLHWADPSFIEIFQIMLKTNAQKALFICTYRPSFKLFEGELSGDLILNYQEIHIKDLGTHEAQEMLKSMLNTKSIPEELYKFVQEKTEGNPFYLEEMINSLIENEILIHDNGNWKQHKKITEADIPATIHGVLMARVDRLEKKFKQILQEASVIGRVFLYKILTKITEIDTSIDQCLLGLENLDLIRTESIEPELEYIFKHALTQEVVYNGLLKKERREIHERIGLTIQQLFPERLPEFYETLAFHFARGKSGEKAVDYLIKAGEKSLARYSVEEAHQYFKQAFKILSGKTDKTPPENLRLIDLLNIWAYAFYYNGDIRGMIELFSRYENLARSLKDESRNGMYYAWLGIAYYIDGQPHIAYEYLTNAISLGEKSKNQKVIGYACSWLAWACPELGRSDEGIAFGERAIKISKLFPSDPYLFFKPLGGICVCNFWIGNIEKILQDSAKLVEYGQKYVNNRSTTIGYFAHSFGNLGAGNIDSVIDSGNKAIEVSRDPFYFYFPRMFVGAGYVLNGQIDRALELFNSSIGYFKQRRLGQVGAFCEMFLGAALIADGKMNRGMKILQKARHDLKKNKRKGMLGVSEIVLGKIFTQIAYGPKPSLGVMGKNIGFLAKHGMFASNKAVVHYKRAVEIFKQISAKGWLGQAYFELGLLFIAKNEKVLAKENLNKALQLFKECACDGFIKRTNEALEAIK